MMNNSISSKSSERVVYFDILNIISCISVVALHHNGIVHSFSNTRAWRQSLIIECGCYWAVPIFLMVSGATLIPYDDRYDTKTFLVKRLKRVFIPWLFWSSVFLLWKVMTGQMQMESRSILYILDLILNNKVESVYWYFPQLIGIYFAIPIITEIRNKKNLLWYIVVINFLFISLPGPIRAFTGYSWNISIPIAQGMFIYPILGYLLHNTKLHKNARLIMYLLGVFCVCFRYFYTLLRSIQSGSTDTSIKGYQYFHCVFLAAAVFVAIKQIPWDTFVSKQVAVLLSKLSAGSFGVYLIHRFIMYYELEAIGISTSRLIWRIAFIPITYLISVIITNLIRRIPLLGTSIMGG